MPETLRILVDASVWTSNYLATSLHFEESYDFLRVARAHGAQLLYGASKLEGMFGTLQAEFARALREQDDPPANADATACAFAWGCIGSIRELGTAVGLDEGDLWLACKYRALGSSLADNVLLAAAERAHADYVVTWSEDLLSSAAVRTATPTQMMAVLSIDS